MANQVRVTSLDALETFRAHLILFLSKSVAALDEVGDEVRRTRSWVHNDQRRHWENEIKKRLRKLQQAEQDYMSARLSALRDSTAGQKQAVLMAKRALAEAEEKLRAVKGWIRNYDNATDPLQKRLSGLRQFLDFDMPKAVAYLVQAQKTLESYTEIPTPEAEAASPPSASGDASTASLARIPMSTKGSASNLIQAVKDLSAEWQMTKDYWRDIKTMEFEEKYIAPLPDYMIRALGVMEELDGILRKVRKDCE